MRGGTVRGDVEVLQSSTTRVGGTRCNGPREARERLRSDARAHRGGKMVGDDREFYTCMTGFVLLMLALVGGLNLIARDVGEDRNKPDAEVIGVEDPEVPPRCRCGADE